MYQSLKEDVGQTKLHSNIEMMTPDLENSLPTPVLRSGIIYYQCQVWIYNQGVMDVLETAGLCTHGMSQWL